MALCEWCGTDLGPHEEYEHDSYDCGCVLRQQRDAARAEVERLRAVLRALLEHYEDVEPGPDTWDIRQQALDALAAEKGGVCTCSLEKDDPSDRHNLKCPLCTAR